MNSNVTSLCPCGSGKEYSECCEPYHLGKLSPPTAEALMRSRYSAFANGVVDYLFETHASANRDKDEKEQLQQTIDKNQWCHLTILKKENGTKKDDKGIVEFIAAFKESGKSEVHALHERSRFIKQEGRWFYLDGETPSTMPLGRNDICWCGSGKKYKKCHG